MTAPTVPTMSVDFASREVNQDPFPHLNAVRELGPAVFNPLIGRWMVGGFDETKRLLADEPQFAPDRAFFDDMFGARVFEADDNPRHNETRGISGPAFRRDRVELLSGVIEEIVADRLDAVVSEVRQDGVCDVVPTFSAAIPALVISHMLGVPTVDIPRFTQWSNTMNGIAEGLIEGSTDRAVKLREDGFAACAAMREYAGGELQRRRDSGFDGDLVGQLAHHPVAQTMTESERRGSVAQLVMAGHETTGKLISHMLITLAHHPEQRRAIVEDRSLIPQTVEEVIRWGGVIGAAVRSARHDVEFEGISIPEGALIFTLPTAANRDPRRWDDPDTFNIFRERKSHVGFGFGTHVCLGLNAARLEARIALDRVLDVMPEYRLVDEEFDFGTNWFVRGPKGVRITF